MSNLNHLHKAEPDVVGTVRGEPVCSYCGDTIKHLPAGQGWVHADGYKLAPNARTYTFVVAAKITAATAQDAWDQWVAKLDDPSWLEANTAVQS